MKQIELKLLLSPVQYDRIVEIGKLTNVTPEEVVTQAIMRHDNLVSEHFRGTKFFMQRVDRKIEPIELFIEEDLEGNLESLTLSSLAPTVSTPIDMEKIREMIQQGRLSDHEADFYKKTNQD